MNPALISAIVYTSVFVYLVVLSIAGFTKRERLFKVLVAVGLTFAVLSLVGCLVALWVIGLGALVVS